MRRMTFTAISEHTHSSFRADSQHGKFSSGPCKFSIEVMEYDCMQVINETPRCIQDRNPEELRSKPRFLLRQRMRKAGQAAVFYIPRKRDKNGIPRRNKKCNAASCRTPGNSRRGDCRTKSRIRDVRRRASGLRSPCAPQTALRSRPPQEIPGPNPAPPECRERRG